jgi:copper(I)-binding protein
MNRTTALRPAAAVALTALLLAGCGESDDGAPDSSPSADASPAGSPARGPGQEASSLRLDSPYVKAAKSGMTAAFGTLVNSGSEDVTVVSATSDITTAMELHETVPDDSGSMVMQPKKGGFVIPAGGSHELSPGGDHLMIMDLTRPVTAGEDITITLTLGDGSTMDVTAPVKDVAGGDETYVGGDKGDMGDMGDMEPGDAESSPTR